MTNQLDLNHLWAQVQELSSILQANRDSTAGLVRRADEIRTRVSHGEGGSFLKDVNGELINGTGPSPELEAELRALREENTTLKADNEDLSLLVTDYVTVLEKVLEGLRVYAHEYTMSTINIHHSYTAQLAHERAINASLRQNEADSQGRLATITKLLRQAYESETSGLVEADGVIAELRYENEVLREALGVSKGGGEEDGGGAGDAGGKEEGTAGTGDAAGVTGAAANIASANTNVMEDV